MDFSKKAVKVLIVMMFFLSAIGYSYAAVSDSVAVKVTVTPSISVSITEDTLSFGSLVAGQVKVSTTAVTVINNGSGINETYSLSLSNPSGWTASQSAAGAETYVLNAAFSSLVGGITWSEANHALSTTPVVSTALKFAGDQTAVAVPYNSSRKLWFQFKAPTQTTVNTEQTITVTVTAQAS